MPVDYGFRRGIDLPEWTWLSMYPQGNSNHGAGVAYDGARYLYWAIQYGTTATTASTTQLWRYCTHTDGWAFLATLTSGNQGIDVEYDPARRLVYALHGASLTTWQAYNPGAASVPVAGGTAAANALLAMPALPAAASTGASITQPDDTASAGALTVNGGASLDGGAVLAGSTATTLDAGPNPGATGTAAAGSTFGPGLVGLAVRFTSGALAGQRRIITGVPNPNRLTVVAFGAAPAAGDVFTVELPEHAVSASPAPTTTTLTVTGAGWTANQYANADVVFVSGALAGQRRRIGSHTADTITLAAAYTAPAANARVGPLTAAPAAGDVFRIVPSSDFIYYQPGGSTTTFYRLDLAQTGAVPTWTTLAAVPGTVSGGGNTFHAGNFSPFAIMAVRGNGTRDVYNYSIGLNTWTTPFTPTGTQETFTTGAAACVLHGKRRILIAKESSSRTYLYDVTTGAYEAGPTVPFAASGGFDGHRARFVRTADGAEFLYLLRAGGPELFRIPVEWL